MKWWWWWRGNIICFNEITKIFTDENIERTRQWLTCNSRASPPASCGPSSLAWGCSGCCSPAGGSAGGSAAASRCRSSRRWGRWGRGTGSGSPPSPGWTGARASSPSSRPPPGGWWCSDCAGRPARPWQPAADGTTDWETSRDSFSLLSLLK